MILTCINPTTLDLNDLTGFVAKIRIISPQSPAGSAKFGNLAKLTFFETPSIWCDLVSPFITLCYFGSPCITLLSPACFTRLGSYPTSYTIFGRLGLSSSSPTPKTSWSPWRTTGGVILLNSMLTSSNNRWLLLLMRICRNYYENLIPASPTDHDHMELKEGSNEDEDFDDQEQDQVNTKTFLSIHFKNILGCTSVGKRSGDTGGGRPWARGRRGGGGEGAEGGDGESWGGEAYPGAPQGGDWGGVEDDEGEGGGGEGETETRAAGPPPIPPSSEPPMTLSGGNHRAVFLLWLFCWYCHRGGGAHMNSMEYLCVKLWFTILSFFGQKLSLGIRRLGSEQNKQGTLMPPPLIKSLKVKTSVSQ